MTSLNMSRAPPGGRVRARTSAVVGRGTPSGAVRPRGLLAAPPPPPQLAACPLSEPPCPGPSRPSPTCDSGRRSSRDRPPRLRPPRTPRRSSRLQVDAGRCRSMQVHAGPCGPRPGGSGVGRGTALTLSPPCPAWPPSPGTFAAHPHGPCRQGTHASAWPWLSRAVRWRSRPRPQRPAAHRRPSETRPPSPRPPRTEVPADRTADAGLRSPAACKGLGRGEGDGAGWRWGGGTHRCERRPPLVFPAAAAADRAADRAAAQRSGRTK